MLNDKLKCDINSLSYNFNNGEGEVHLSRLSKCDMEGCIELFELIDDNINKIYVYCENKFDILYLQQFGHWVACNIIKDTGQNNE